MQEFNKKIVELFNEKAIKENPTCYVYDLNILDRQIENVQRYAPPNLKVYYAMKANPNKDILKHFSKHKFIERIEIASIGELEIASPFFPMSKVLFTGPGKTEKELELSIRNGIRFINVESIVEAIRINEIAKRLNIAKVPILLRINTNYCIYDAEESMAGISTKMGIDQNTFLQEIEYIKGLPHIDVKGLHVFAATGVLNYKVLIKYVDYVFAYINRIQEDLFFSIDVIDFGGGIGIDYSEYNEEFDCESFFTELQTLMNDYGFSGKEIIMELGRYLVGPAGYYISKILDIKDIKGYKHIVLAGGINHFHLPYSVGVKCPLYMIHLGEPKLYPEQPIVSQEKADIGGPLCMSNDKVAWDEHIEHAEIGDIVVFKQGGAYGYSWSVLKFLSHEYPKEIILQKM